MSQPDRHPFKQFADPSDRRKGWFFPHLGIIALIILGLFAAFGLGWYSHQESTNWAQFFRSHNSAFLGGKAKRPDLPPVPPKSGIALAPSHGWVHFAYLPGVTNQLQSNSCTEQEYVHALGYDVTRVATGLIHRLFSARALYDLINGTANSATGGNGTSSDQAELAANTHGLIRHKDYDYPESGPTPFESAPPGKLPVEYHNSWLEWLYISSGDGTSDAGLNDIDTALANHEIVGVGMEAYDGPTGMNTAGATGIYDTANLTRNMGGHMLSLVGYDKTKVIHGVKGWYFAQQSWGSRYGVTVTGRPNNGGTHGGYLWISRRLIKRLSYDAVVVHLGAHPDVYRSAAHPSNRTPLGAADGGKQPVPPPTQEPTKPRTNGVPAKGSAAWYVHGVTLTTGADVSGLINHYGDQYGVWPVGLAATLGIESGLNPYAERWGAGLDQSCGLSQVIITNVAYYTGIQGARAECNWSENPANAIYLMARIYGEYFAYQKGCVTWPYAYGMYNGGAGYPCSYYYNPSGDIAAHVQVFMGWYNYAIAHWQGGVTPPPPPPVTPQHHRKSAHFGKLAARVWSQYRLEHHLSFIPHRGWFALHWRRGDFRHAGGIVQHEQWNPKRHTMTEFLQGGWAWFWPHHPKWGTTWKGHPWMR